MKVLQSSKLSGMFYYNAPSKKNKALVPGGTATMLNVLRCQIV